MCGRALIVPREVVEQIVQDIIRKRVANYLPDWPAVRHSFRPSDEVTVIVPVTAGSTAFAEKRASSVASADSFTSGSVSADKPHFTGSITRTESLTQKLDTSSNDKPTPALEAKTLRWGYEAPWSKGPLFNTRFETALDATKPNMWHDSLLNRRCIVPTLGFYETHKTETFINPHTGKSNKQQYLFTMPDSLITYLAGIYQDNRFSLMTTRPNAYVEPVHDRMPVVLKESELFTWLGSDFSKLIDRSEVVLTVEREQHPGSAADTQLSLF